ncbi:MAG: Wzz/FepE/Etk N-terminal domain-containing protein [Terracidiphilus sp.]|jgi:polysaccharide chain length determinant protein (PEP-CTERM system associated)
MLGHRELTMQDYAEMLKRRLWLILAFTVLLLGIGLGVSYILPPQYVSQTLVLIEQQKVPEDYVKPIVNEDLGARLASMKEQILSRSRIEPIIERFNLYPGSKYTMDDRVELTRKAIGINPIRSDQSHGMPGFFISFKAQDAHTAQQVCGEITSLFVSANLNAREESAEGTTDFLKQQLADSKRNLDDQDGKLADFERKYIGKLPSQESANLNTLQALTTQLDAATQTVSRIEQDEAFQTAMIAQQMQESSRVDPATGTSEDALKNQLKDATAQEKELEAIYTPDHPDIAAIKRRIANLRAEIARDSAEPAKAENGSSSSSDAPQLQQLKARLRATKQSSDAAKQEQARIENEVRTYESRVESSPMIEEEYKQVTRDHDTALQFYNALLAKMNESSMATALERRQQGEQFRVMDAPNLPDAPTFPNHLVFSGEGLASGLILGLLLAALLEYRDTSLRNESDVWVFTKLPTLAVISYIQDMPYTRAAHGRGKLFSRTTKPIESARG